MSDVHDLQRAVLGARRRLRTEGIGIEAKGGLIRIVDVTYLVNGESAVQPLSEWRPLAEAIDLLEGERCPACGWLSDAPTCAGCGGRIPSQDAIREVEVRYKKSDVPLARGARFSNAKDVFDAFKDDMASFPVEVFRVVFLDTKNGMIAFEDISRGSLSSSVVTPREAFWSAVHLRSSGVLFLHNHPSGDPVPSREDRIVTEKLMEAGRILGIRVVDHIVFGSDDFFSFADAGLLAQQGSGAEILAERGGRRP